MFFVWIFILCTYMWAKEEVNSSDSCEKFAAFLVTQVNNGTMTEQEALGYIKNPSNPSVNPPQSVREFMKTSAYTPPEIYKLVLHLESLNEDECVDDLGEKAYEATRKGRSVEEVEGSSVFQQWLGALEARRNFWFDADLMTIEEMLCNLKKEEVSPLECQQKISGFLKSLIEETSQIRFSLMTPEKLQSQGCELESTVSNLKFWQGELLTKETGVRDSAMPLREELASEKWSKDMLIALFGEKVARPYLESPELFETLKTHEGFTKICQEATEYIEQHVLYLGKKNKDGELAWRQILPEFLESLGCKKYQDYAKEALENMAVLCGLVKSVYFENACLIATMYDMFDVFKGKSGAGPKNPLVSEEAILGDTSYYANLVHRACAQNLSDGVVDSEKAKKFLDIILCFDESAVVFKARNTIYPAFACVWAAQRNITGILGCPFGFSIDVDSLSAHGGAYDTLLSLMDHDGAHFKYNNNKKEAVFALVKRSSALWSSKSCYESVGSAVPYYQLLLMAMACNDLMVTDFEFFAILKPLVTPESLGEKDLLKKDVFEKSSSLLQGDPTDKGLCECLWRRKIQVSLAKACEYFAQRSLLEMQYLGFSVRSANLWNFSKSPKGLYLMTCCIEGKYKKLFRVCLSDMVSK